MRKRGKKFAAARAQIAVDRTYSIEEAIPLMQKVKFAKFDETIEMALKLGVDPKHADQMVRGTVVLPNGLGKSKRVLAIAGGEKQKEAQEAGADVVGGEDLAKRIEDGFDDFDVAIATPDMMSVVGRLGRLLGPSGKMPNPKVGTVTMEVTKAVEESKSGKVEYRTDRTAIVHLAIGKTSFADRQLLENYAAVIEELVRAKPSVAKGRYLRSITMASTMGPGVKVDSSRTRDIIEEAPQATIAA
jgi:large subunit ribosomal protein L1